MPIFMQIIIGLVLLSISSIFLYKQVNLLSAIRAGAAVRDDVLQICIMVLDDEDESEQAKARAAHIGRLALNDESLRLMAVAESKGKLRSLPNVQKPKARKVVNEDALKVAASAVAYMSLCYHPKHGRTMRKVMRERIKIKANRVSAADDSECKYVLPTIPKTTKQDTKILEKYVEDGLVLAA